MEEESPYDIGIALPAGQEDVDEPLLVRAVEATLRAHDVPRASISIALVDDPAIAEINKTHLNHQGPTDVITFDLRDEPAAPVEGEIVVSIDTATRESAARGHDLSAELGLYVVHGTLHLLGYDDHEEADAARMHAREDEILTALGVGSIYGKAG